MLPQAKIMYPESDGQHVADGDLIEIDVMSGWVSPRLGVRFDLKEDELQLYYPDGRKFASYIEQAEQAEQSRQRAEQAQDRAERLAAQLRALGVEPE